MATPSKIDKKIATWVGAGIIDPSTAEKLRSYEAEHRGQFRWLTFLALGLGAVMLAAGVLLFVAAHWDKLSPAERFTLVLAMVALFHVSGGVFGERSEALQTTLHGLGTLALGAGIFLAGQIFNLQEHWPGGVMLWALGALFGWLILRDWVQTTLFALLTPAWIFCEWMEGTRRYIASDRIVSMGIAAIALVYFTSVFDDEPTPLRRALRWAGGICLLPAFEILFDSHESYWGWRQAYGSLGLRVFGYVLFLGGSLLISVLFRRRFDPWTAGLLAWTGALSFLAAFARWEIVLYGWCALGSVALIGWGLSEYRRERINMGVAAFALTVVSFYFSSVMDKLGRSFALMLFGLLFLAGGWLLEKTRRRLVARVREARA